MRTLIALGLVSIVLGLLPFRADAQDDHSATDELDLVILTDVSASMLHADKGAVSRRNWLEVFLRAASIDGGIRIGWVQFTNEIKRHLDVDRMPTSRLDCDKFIKTLTSFGSDSGGTDLAVALRKAAVLLQRAEDGSGRKKAVLLISDGDFDRASGLLVGRIPAWRDPSHKCRIFPGLQKLRDLGAILYTVPVTPLTRGFDSDADRNQYTPDKRRKYQAGEDLLRRMAEHTGGRAFTPRPGSYGFNEVFIQSLRDRLTHSVRQMDAAKSGALINPIIRAFMVTTRGEIMITLPDGRTLEIPLLEPGKSRLFRPDGPGGVEVSFRGYEGGLSVIVFYRPSQSADISYRKGWPGTYRFSQGERVMGKGGDFNVITFPDLKPGFNPPLASSYWRGERVRLTIPFDTRLLTDWDGAREAIETLSCRVRVIERGRKGSRSSAGGRGTPAKRISDREFEIDLGFDRPGLFDLEFDFHSSYESKERVLVLKTDRPIRVLDEDPISVSGFKIRKGKRETVFDNEATGVSSVAERDRFVIRIDSKTAIREVKRLNDPDYFEFIEEKKGSESGRELQYVVMPGRNGGGEDIELEVTTDSPDGSRPAVIRKKLPFIPISNREIQTRADLRLVDDIYLYANERDAELVFQISFQGILLDRADRAPQVLSVAIHDAIDPLAQSTAMAERIGRAVEGHRNGGTPSVEVGYVLKIPDGLFDHPADYKFKIDDLVLGLQIPPSGFSIHRCPIQVTLQSQSNSDSDERSLRGFEPLTVDLSVSVNDVQLMRAGVARIERIKPTGPEFLQSAEFVQKDGQSATAHFESLELESGTIFLAVDVDLKDGARKRDGIEFAFPMPFPVETRKFNAIAELRIETPVARPPRSNEKLRGSLTINLVGGRPDERDHHKKIISRYVSGHLPELVRAQRENENCISAGSLKCDKIVVNPIGTRGTKVVVDFSFRLERSGLTELTAVFPKDIDELKKIVVKSNILDVEPSKLRMRINQPLVNDRPLFDTNGANESLPRVVAGLPLEVVVDPGPGVRSRQLQAIEPTLSINGRVHSRFRFDESKGAFERIPGERFSDGAIEQGDHDFIFTAKDENGTVVMETGKIEIHAFRPKIDFNLALLEFPTLVPTNITEEDWKGLLCFEGKMRAAEIASAFERDLEFRLEATVDHVSRISTRLSRMSGARGDSRKWSLSCPDLGDLAEVIRKEGTDLEFRVVAFKKTAGGRELPVGTSGVLAETMVSSLVTLRASIYDPREKKKLKASFEGDARVARNLKGPVELRLSVVVNRAGFERAGSRLPKNHGLKPVLIVDGVEEFPEILTQTDNEDGSTELVFVHQIEADSHCSAKLEGVIPFAEEGGRAFHIDDAKLLFEFEFHEPFPFLLVLGGVGLFLMVVLGWGQITRRVGGDPHGRLGLTIKAQGTSLEIGCVDTRETLNIGSGKETTSEPALGALAVFRMGLGRTCIYRLSHRDVEKSDVFLQFTHDRSGSLYFREILNPLKAEILPPAGAQEQAAGAFSWLVPRVPSSWNRINRKVNEESSVFKIHWKDVRGFHGGKFRINYRPSQSRVRQTVRPDGGLS